MTVVLSKNIPSKEKVCKEALRHFVKKGTARLGDDSLVENAINLCMKHGIGDITIFDSPQDVINKYGSNMETKQLNPDDFKTLTNRTEYPLRLVTYDVEPSEQGFKDFMEIWKNVADDCDADFMSTDVNGNFTEESVKSFKKIYTDGGCIKLSFRDGELTGCGYRESFLSKKIVWYSVDGFDEFDCRCGIPFSVEKPKNSPSIWGNRHYLFFDVTDYSLHHLISGNYINTFTNTNNFSSNSFINSQLWDFVELDNNGQERLKYHYDTELRKVVISGDTGCNENFIEHFLSDKDFPSEKVKNSHFSKKTVL